MDNEKMLVAPRTYASPEEGQRESEVGKAFNKAFSSLEHNGKLIYEIEARLVKVLRENYATKEATEDAKNESIGVPLADELMELVYQIERQTSKLKSIMQRIEV